MRIAGINCPDANNQRPHHSSSDSGSPKTPAIASDSAAKCSENLACPVNAHENGQNNIGFQHHHRTGNTDKKRSGADFDSLHLPTVTQDQHVQSSVKETSGIGSGKRVQFFTQPGVVRNAYDSWHAGNAVPDNTAYKAQEAISQYLQTQYIEERRRFTEVLGVDDFA